MYILTKYETVRRTEKVEYAVDIPENIRNKTAYALKQVENVDYTGCQVVDIVDSELLDVEVDSLRKVE